MHSFDKSGLQFSLVSTGKGVSMEEGYLNSQAVG